MASLSDGATASVGRDGELNRAKTREDDKTPAGGEEEEAKAKATSQPRADVTTICWLSRLPTALVCNTASFLSVWSHVSLATTSRGHRATCSLPQASPHEWRVWQTGRQDDERERKRWQIAGPWPPSITRWHLRSLCGWRVEAATTTYLQMSDALFAQLCGLCTLQHSLTHLSFCLLPTTACTSLAPLAQLRSLRSLDFGYAWCNRDLVSSLTGLSDLTCLDTLGVAPTLPLTVLGFLPRSLTHIRGLGTMAGLASFALHCATFDACPDIYDQQEDEEFLNNVKNHVKTTSAASIDELWTSPSPSLALSLRPVGHQQQEEQHQHQHQHKGRRHQQYPALTSLVLDEHEHTFYSGVAPSICSGVMIQECELRAIARAAPALKHLQFHYWQRPPAFLVSLHCLSALTCLESLALIGQSKFVYANVDPVMDVVRGWCGDLDPDPAEDCKATSHHEIHYEDGAKGSVHTLPRRRQALKELSLEYFDLELPDTVARLAMVCSKLLCLTLASCALTNDGLACLSSVVHLQHLRLWEARGITSLAGLPPLGQLTHLQVGGARLCGMSALPLSVHLPTLVHLDLEASSVSRVDPAQWQAAYPRCRTFTLPPCV